MKNKAYAYFAREDESGAWRVAIAQPDGWNYIPDDCDVGGPMNDEADARGVAGRCNRLYLDISAADAAERCAQWATVTP